MTQAAEVKLHDNGQPELDSTTAQTLPTAAEAHIQPEMARLLEMTQANGSSLTPREINAQLDRVLHDYDELTAQYAANNRRIDSELAAISQSGASLSSSLHLLNADMRQHNEHLDGQFAATENRFIHVEQETASLRDGLQISRQEIQDLQIQAHNGHSATETLRGNVEALRGETYSRLADTVQHFEQRLADENGRVGREISRLDNHLERVDALLQAQERILGEQRQRLDQFDITYQLLDSATRGNKQRIEVVRAETVKEHALAATRIDGLSALQREHHAEFQQLQGLVGVLKAETQRLEQAIVSVASDLTAHRTGTQEQFKRTHLALGGLLLLSALGFAAVKWWPAFAPASTQQALAQNQAQLAEINGQVAGLSTQETAQQAINARQQATLDQVSGQVASLEKSLNDLRAAMRRMPAPVAGAGILHDSQWLQRQNPKAYTVQLLTSPSETDMARFIDQNVDRLALNSLAFSVSDNQRERYNLFFGVFNSPTQARAAIAALPPALQSNRPWVRSLGSVQKSLR